MPIKNKVQLITYPDSLGGNLRTLYDVLQKHFPNSFQGGIHILPPFPSSGDRGFAPLTYLEIEPVFGSWQDIQHLSEDYDILLDLMVNHISRQSPFFQDFLNKGKQSKYYDMFLTIDKLWPDGFPSREEIEKIFLRRTEPYSTYTIQETGENVTVWTTFGQTTPSEQIDLDVHSNVTRHLLSDFLTQFSANGVKIVRLDALPYVIKIPGTTCFMIEPEVYDFLNWISDLAHSSGIELLPEVHAHYTTQFKLVEHGYWIYDFILPYMILELFITRSSARIRDYLKIRPAKQFTMLDCHDGIPIKPDLDDLVSADDARKVIDHCFERGANPSRVFSSKYQNSDGFDVHQIRCSYYSMLDCDDDAYLAARAIQFFVPGVPQVYYVGLLAGENDEENTRRTGEGREINRHNFTLEEIDWAAQQDVVKRLKSLIHFRNTHPAFDGTFEVVDTTDDQLVLGWKLDEHRCVLQVDLYTNAAVVTYTEKGSETLLIYQL
ncbi:MAG: sucrose phosphorylase [Anaerolineae bacterium]|nr:sucrose phosphorylase [Anaerolineae bacterium]